MYFNSYHKSWVCRDCLHTLPEDAPLKKVKWDTERECPRCTEIQAKHPDLVAWLIDIIDGKINSHKSDEH